MPHWHCRGTAPAWPAFAGRGGLCGRVRQRQPDQPGRFFHFVRIWFRARRWPRGHGGFRGWFSRRFRCRFGGGRRGGCRLGGRFRRSRGRRFRRGSRFCRGGRRGRRFLCGRCGGGRRGGQHGVGGYGFLVEEHGGVRLGVVRFPGVIGPSVLGPDIGDLHGGGAGEIGRRTAHIQRCKQRRTRRRQTERPQ